MRAEETLRDCSAMRTSSHSVDPQFEKLLRTPPQSLFHTLPSTADGWEGFRGRLPGFGLYTTPAFCTGVAWTISFTHVYIYSCPANWTLRNAHTWAGDGSR